MGAPDKLSALAALKARRQQASTIAGEPNAAGTSGSPATGTAAAGKWRGWCICTPACGTRLNGLGDFGVTGRTLCCRRCCYYQSRSTHASVLDGTRNGDGITACALRHRQRRCIYSSSNINARPCDGSSSSRARPALLGAHTDGRRTPCTSPQLQLQHPHQCCSQRHPKRQ